MLRTFKIVGSLIMIFCSCHLYGQKAMFNEVADSMDFYLRAGDLTKMSLFLDSAINISKTSLDNLQIAQVYYYKSSLVAKSNSEKSLELADSAILFSKKAKNKTWWHKSSYLKSKIYRNSGNFQGSKLNRINTEAEMVEIPPERLFNHYRGMALDIRDLGELDSALFYLLKADSLARKSENKTENYLIKQSIGSLLMDLEEYEKALKYHEEVYELSQNSSSRNKMYANYNLGRVYFTLNKKQEALKLIEVASQQAIELGDSINLCNYTGMIGNIYEGLESYSSALTYYKASLVLSEKLVLKDLSATNLANIGEIYFRTNKLNRAVEYTEAAAGIFQELGLMSQTEQSYNNLYHIYKKNGEYEKALSAFDKFHAYRDTLNNLERQKSKDNFELKFETLEKEKAILALTKQNEIQSLKINQRNITLFVSSILFLFFAVMIYLFFRSRLISEKLQKMESKQRFLRAQISPHFLFNALASIRSYIFEEKNIGLVLSYMSRFTKLMRDILEQSNVENITLEEELETLSCYVELQQLRFDHKFKYQVTLDENVSTTNTYIPPLFLQPFLENAIEHGVSHVENGSVELKIMKNKNQLIIKITNNGYGIAAENFLKNKSLSTAIQQERLTLLSGEFQTHFKVIPETIFDGDNPIGYLVTIKLPLEISLNN